MPENISHWRKSSRSNGQGGNCVEIGSTADGAVTGIRDTKQAADPDRPTLAFTGAAFSSFLSRVKSGELG